MGVIFGSFPQETWRPGNKCICSRASMSLGDLSALLKGEGNIRFPRMSQKSMLVDSRFLPFLFVCYDNVINKQTGDEV